MFPIELNSENKSAGYKEFADRFIEICKQHKGEDRALAFAFILYDFTNADVSKVLKDKDYWLALNHISGKYLTVFSFHYVSPEEDKPLMHMMTTISTNLNPAFASNKLISTFFPKMYVRYPALLFFQVNNETVTDVLLVQLKREGREAAYSEMKNLIKLASEALSKITDENKNNHQEIFNCLKSAIQGSKNFEMAKALLKNGISVAQLLLKIKGLLPFG